ncbi:MAG: hypothetical protein AAGI38_03670 [Bacteroidota bacterium]
MKSSLLLSFLLSITLLSFSQSITLSGAPESVLNSTYYFSGNYLGKGDFLNPGGSQSIYWNGNQWRVQVHGQDIYYHPADTEEPPSTGWVNVDKQSVSTLNLAGCVDKYAMESVTIVQENEKPSIVWTTKKEYKCKAYFIETSNDGLTWLKIGEMEGMGNTLSTHHYRFPLRNLAPGFIHFRVKQIAENGAENISNQCILSNQILPLTFFEE